MAAREEGVVDLATAAAVAGLVEEKEGGLEEALELVRQVEKVDQMEAMADNLEVLKVVAVQWEVALTAAAARDLAEVAGFAGRVKVEEVEAVVRWEEKGEAEMELVEVAVERQAVEVWAAAVDPESAVSEAVDLAVADLAMAES